MRVAQEIVRIIVVMAFVAYAAVLLTPKGRLPLAMRGLAKLLGKEMPGSCDPRGCGNVPLGRRLLGMILVVFAFLLAIIRL